MHIQLCEKAKGFDQPRYIFRMQVLLYPAALQKYRELSVKQSPSRVIVRYSHHTPLQWAK